MVEGDLLEAAERWATVSPDALAFTDLTHDLQVRDAVTFHELYRRVRGRAARLSNRFAPGAHVLLFTPHSLDYLVDFLACLMAGIVPVSGTPAYPPGARTQRHRARLQRIQWILEDAKVDAVLGPAPLLAQLREALGGGAPAMVPHEEDLTDDPLWKGAASSADEIAFLQYTSGSTASPGGVVIRHRNLVSNLRAQGSALGVSRADIGVSWLPLYHDLGLIGACLLPLYVGFPVTLLPSAGFIAEPWRWLECMSTSRATITWAPNFAYNLAARAASDHNVEDLSLSTWRVAVNAAETVQAETLTSFANSFRRAGFERRAFRPCYGLAEATLAVSISDGDIATVRADRRALQDRRIILRPDHWSPASTVELVSCGAPISDTAIHIVDERRLEPAAANTIGEIWIQGPGASSGYFGGDGTFARESCVSDLPGYTGTFARTGDLGFLKDGELFIVGRCKDTIILGGANFYPTDLERFAESCHPSIESACAFPVLTAGGEALGVACEIDRRSEALAAEAASAVRQVLFAEFGVMARVVAVLRRGTLPRTPSGKIQRQLCASQLQNGEMQCLAQDLLHQAKVEDADENPPESWLWRQLSTLATEPIVAETVLVDLGLSSRQITELAAELEARFGIDLPVAELFEAVSWSDLLGRLDHAKGKTVRPPREQSTR